MTLDVIRLTTGEALDRYAAIPMVLEVASYYAVEAAPDDAVGIVLRERSVPVPYVKDYDQQDGGPATWPGRFDLSEWNIIMAVDDGRDVGAAAACPGFPGDPSSAAVLWDIRVEAGSRRSRIGTVLVREQCSWARRNGYDWLKAETQNVNVTACHFYRRLGGRLGAIDRFAYADQPAIATEVRLEWYLPTTLST